MDWSTKVKSEAKSIESSHYDGHIEWRKSFIRVFQPLKSVEKNWIAELHKSSPTIYCQQFAFINTIIVQMRADVVVNERHVQCERI